MLGWLNRNQGAIAAIGTILTVLLALGTLLWRELRRIRKDGAEQVQRQRNFDQTWYGKDPEYPGGERTPGMPERVAAIEKNTAGMPERLTDVESGLGKANDRLDTFDRRLTAVEGVVLGRPVIPE